MKNNSKKASKSSRGNSGSVLKRAARRSVQMNILDKYFGLRNLKVDIERTFEGKTLCFDYEEPVSGALVKILGPEVWDCCDVEARESIIPYKRYAQGKDVLFLLDRDLLNECGCSHELRFFRNEGESMDQFTPKQVYSLTRGEIGMQDVGGVMQYILSPGDLALEAWKQANNEDREFWRRVAKQRVEDGCNVAFSGITMEECEKVMVSRSILDVLMSEVDANEIGLVLSLQKLGN